MSTAGSDFGEAGPIAAAVAGVGIGGGYMMTSNVRCDYCWCDCCWDEKLIRNCFDNAIKEMQIYDLDPKIAEELYFSGQQITRKNILDARKATS